MFKFLFSLLGLLIFSASAQMLSLQECIDKSLNNHPDLKSVELKLQQSKTLTRAIKADYMPQITLNAEYDPIKTFALPLNGQFRTIDDDNIQAGVVLNQKIWDFSKTSSTIKAYEKNYSIAKLSLNEAKALMVYNIKVQYGLLVIYKKSLEVRKQDLKVKEELYKQAKALVDEGIKTKADATSFLSALYIAKNNLAIAQADFDKARETLSLYIGENIKKDIALQEDVLSYKTDKEFDKKTLYKNIKQNSPTLQSSSLEISKNNLIHKATKASAYGSLDAIASYNYLNSLNEYDTTLVGITLKIPIYTGGRISAQTQQAQISKEIAKESYNAKDLSIKEELNNLLIDLKRYKFTIEAKKSLVESSQATKEILQARYKEGLSTYIEVLDATSIYLNAKLGLLQAKFENNKILNRLDYLQGNIK